MMIIIGDAFAPSPANAGEGWGGVPSDQVILSGASQLGSSSNSSDPTSPPPNLPLHSQGEELKAKALR